MSRYSSAYSGYVSRTEEVLTLARRARTLERSRLAFSSATEIDALCRGAIVLLSSHIEAYVKELGELYLETIYRKRVCRSKFPDKFFYYTTRPSVESLQENSDPEKISIQIFQFLSNDADVWAKTGQFPRLIPADGFSKGFSNPKFLRIKKYVSRFGYLTIENDVMRRLGRRGRPLITSLDQIVDSRNAIAHGEASATKTPLEVMDLVESSKQICRVIDDCFCSWASSNVCSLR